MTSIQVDIVRLSQFARQFNREVLGDEPLYAQADLINFKTVDIILFVVSGNAPVVANVPGGTQAPGGGVVQACNNCFAAVGARFNAAITTESKKVLNVSTPAVNITTIVDVVVAVTQDKRGVLSKVFTNTEAPGIYL